MRMSGAQKFNRADGCDAKTYTWQMQVPATPKMAIDLLYTAGLLVLETCAISGDGLVGTEFDRR